MAVVLEAVYDAEQGVLKLKWKPDLPDQSRVKVIVETPPPPESLARELASVIGLDEDDLRRAAEGEAPESEHVLVRLGAKTQEIDGIDIGPKIPQGLRFQTIIPEEDIEDFVRERGFEPTPERKRLVHERLAMAGREAIAFAASYTNWKGILGGASPRMKSND